MYIDYKDKEASVSELAKIIENHYKSIIDNLDVLGEILREWAFKEEYGCYSCFDLIDGFTEVEVTTREFKMMWGRDYDPESTGDIWGDPDSWYIKQITWYKHENGIEVGWFWDGDGTLVFYVPEIDTLLINTDCKSDYGWGSFQNYQSTIGVDNVIS